MGKTLDKPLLEQLLAKQLSVTTCLLITFLGQISVGQTITEKTTGIVSLVDIYIDPDGLLDSATCLAETGLNLDVDAKRACMPNIEVIYIPAFDDCMTTSGDLVSCSKDPTYHIPFITEAMKNKMDNDIYSAWSKFVDHVRDEVGDELVSWLPCSCGDAGCIAQRTAKGVEQAIAKYYPMYWQEVYQAVATYAPMALHWQNPTLTKGAIIAPFYDFEPKPTQYAYLVEEPRDVAYYFSTEPIPYIPSELNQSSGGLTEKELKKVFLQEATLAEYQQFGFTALWELYGSWSFQIVWGVRAGFCVTGSFFGIPIVVPTVYPIAAPLYVIKGFTDNVIVPEGYAIPRVSGKPLF